MRTPQQIEPHVRRLRAFVSANRSADALDAMLAAYYRDSASLEARHQDARAIGASTFEQLFSLRLAASSHHDPFFQHALSLLVDRSTSAGADDPLWMRFQGLDRVLQSAIVAALVAKQRDKKANLFFLEILEDLYAQSHGRLPDDVPELLAFEPTVASGLRAEYDARVAAILQAATGGSEAAAELERELADFGAWALSPRDMARAFAVLRWSRLQAQTVRRRYAVDPASLALLEIYLIAVQKAVISAMADHLLVQTNMLTEVEVALLMQPLVGTYYQSNYADRLSPFADNDRHATGRFFTDMGALHLRLAIVADDLEITLVPTDEAEHVANVLRRSPPPMLRPPVFIGTPQLAAAAVTVQVGDHIAGVGKLVDVHASGSYYINVDGIDHYLFRVNPHVMSAKLENYLWGELRKGTEHLLELIPAYFSFLEYVVSFATGGFPALLEEIAETYIAEAFAGLVEDVTGNPALGTLVGMVGGPATLAVPTRRLAKRVARPAVRAVRERVRRLRSPEPGMPRAVARFKKKAKARRPKIKQPTFDEVKAAKALTAKINSLKTQKVRLGGQTADGYAEVTASDALKQLFSGPISGIPRLSKHWPQEKLKECVEAVKDRIRRGAPDELADRVAKALETGDLPPDLLSKLPQTVRDDVKKIVKDNWDSIREMFWRRVYRDDDLRKELKKLGVEFNPRGASKPFQPGGSPCYELDGHRIDLTLDHDLRKVTNPLRAFDPNNLRVMTSRENSGQKEALVKYIEQRLGIDHDAYLRLPPGPQALPAELAKALRELPLEEDFLASTFHQ